MSFSTDILKDSLAELEMYQFVEKTKLPQEEYEEKVLNLKQTIIALKFNNFNDFIHNVVPSVLVEVSEKIIEKLKHCYNQRDDDMDDQMWHELTSEWLDYLEEKIPTK